MLRHRKHKIIATFLLIVFFLNTVAGFACSVGLNMGYNLKHHEDKITFEHSHDKQHVHDASHKHHDETSPEQSNDPGNKDDCCSNEVAKFIQLDKAFVNNIFTLQVPSFLLPFTVSFFIRIQDEMAGSVN